MMILGDLFLKNFYSVFDYEKKQIGLAVDTNSKGAKMFKANS